MAPSTILLPQLSCADSGESKADGSAIDGLQEKVSSISLIAGGEPYFPADPTIRPRSYQLEVFERAREENTIIVMETGCGKTLIAVMLIYDLADRIRKPSNNIAVFLAPTVPLAQQQKEVIERLTRFKVGCYYGGVGDSWTHDYWEGEIGKNEVFVMTPEILYNNLCHCFFKMDMIEILIFDECHHARKKAQYAAIMNGFYFKQIGRRPRVFGMTAVPFIGCTRGGCASMTAELDTLESLLHAKVYTITDKTELEHVNPSPTQSFCYFDSPYLPRYVAVLQQRFEELKAKCVRSLLLEEELGIRAGRQNEIKKRLKKLGRRCNTLDYCLVKLGLWCTQKAVELLDKDEPEFSGEAELEYGCERAFLQNIRVELTAACSKDDNTVDITYDDFSSKVVALLDLLDGYRNSSDLKCIVFVERVIAATVLAELLSNMDSFSFLRCKSLTGSHSGVKSMSRQQQQSLVEDFREGKVNLLVATNIAEEGLDIQTCGLIIRFDLPKTLRSFVQSRGRARRRGSKYVILVERGDSEAESCINNLLECEGQVAKEARRREELGRELPHPKTHDVEVYCVESTGATVNTDCSVQLLYRYCSKLPGDKFYSPAPEFDLIPCPEGGMVCRVTLPPNAPFRHVVGHGKRAACLEACKQLHACGALTDYLLLPSDVEDEEETPFSSRKKNIAASRAPELYHKLLPSGFHGACIAKGAAAALLHVYCICLAPEPIDREYAEFALFLEVALDNELGSIEVMLNLSSGRTVNAKLNQAGQLSLDQNQIHEAKVFQTYLFTTVLDPDGHPLAPLSLGGQNIPVMDVWDPSLSYLLLPLLPNARMESDPFSHVGQVEIDWSVIKKVISTRGISPNGYCETEEPVYKDMSKEQSKVEVLQVADGLASVENIVDAMVVVKHAESKQFYRVVEVLHDLNANSPFSDPKFASYTEYFHIKHGETLVHTKQPLLRVTPMKTVHNLLSRHSTGVSAVVPKPEMKMELPPELCKIRVLGFAGKVINTVSLLPSLMHRLGSMLVANELRVKLAVGIPEAAKIPTMKILTSLTTRKCDETFDLESLELLGDAFLKFAVTQRLFLVYEKKHEGQLTIRRIRAICNSTLCNLGVLSDLPAFIRDEAFSPKRCAIPGYQRRLSCDPNKMTEIHDCKIRPDLQCSLGHRWMYEKTIADVVEALIGTHLVECGQNGALSFMRWVGVAVDFDPILKVQAQKHDEENAAHFSGLVIEIENKLNYTFRSKALAVEAVTHASYHYPLGHCYQRLEFLGDAVLDFVITKHLVFTFPDLKPGLLTDLRSASVNNDAFARVAVKHNLHQSLLHTSTDLMYEVKEFLSFLQLDPSDAELCHGWEGDKSPKVLGDLVESLAGAVLVDSGFNVDKVWEVFEPLLTPFVTLDTLQLHPVRELRELCQLHKFELEFKMTEHGRLKSVTATVDVKGVIITRHAEKRDSKSAERIAARGALYELQELGHRHPRHSLIEGLFPHRGNKEEIGVRLKPSVLPELIELGAVCSTERGTPCSRSSQELGAVNSKNEPVDCAPFPKLWSQHQAGSEDKSFQPEMKCAHEDAAKVELSIPSPSDAIKATKSDADGTIKDIDMVEFFRLQYSMDKSRRIVASMVETNGVGGCQKGTVGSRVGVPVEEFTSFYGTKFGTSGSCRSQTTSTGTVPGFTNLARESGACRDDAKRRTKEGMGNTVGSSQQGTGRSNVGGPVGTAYPNNPLNGAFRTEGGTPGSRSSQDSSVESTVKPLDCAPFLKFWSQHQGGSEAISVEPKMKCVHEDAVKVERITPTPSGNVQATKGDADGTLKGDVDMVEFFRLQYSMDKSRRIVAIENNKVGGCQKGTVGSSVGVPAETTCSSNLFEFSSVYGTTFGTSEGSCSSQTTTTGTGPGFTNLAREAGLGKPGSCSPQESSNAYKPMDYAPFLLKMLSQHEGGPQAASRGTVPDCTESDHLCDPAITEARYGYNRAKLYETCAQKKWPSPEFSVIEGGAGLARFQCVVKLKIQSRQTAHFNGHEFGKKKDAMDSAASFALDWLKQEGFI